MCYTYETLGQPQPGYFDLVLNLNKNCGRFIFLYLLTELCDSHTHLIQIGLALWVLSVILPCLVIDLYSLYSLKSGIIHVILYCYYTVYYSFV